MFCTINKKEQEMFRVVLRNPCQRHSDTEYVLPLPTQQTLWAPSTRHIYRSTAYLNKGLRLFLLVMIMCDSTLTNMVNLEKHKNAYIMHMQTHVYLPIACPSCAHIAPPTPVVTTTRGLAASSDHHAPHPSHTLLYSPPPMI